MHLNCGQSFAEMRSDDCQAPEMQHHQRHDENPEHILAGFFALGALKPLRPPIHRESTEMSSDHNQNNANDGVAGTLRKLKLALIGRFSCGRDIARASELQHSVQGGGSDRNFDGFFIRMGATKVEFRVPVSAEGYSPRGRPGRLGRAQRPALARSLLSYP
jgi:hypothetical protein